jgi:hypothetical protein
VLLFHGASWGMTGRRVRNDNFNIMLLKYFAKKTKS